MTRPRAGARPLPRCSDARPARGNPAARRRAAGLQHRPRHGLAGRRRPQLRRGHRPPRPGAVAGDRRSRPVRGPRRRPHLTTAGDSTGWTASARTRSPSSGRSPSAAAQHAARTWRAGRAHRLRRLRARPGRGRRSAATGTTSSTSATGGSRSRVGDVAGHGLRAAATMGKLRSATRVEGLNAQCPAEALTALDRFARTLDRPAAGHRRLCRPGSARRATRYALAGHPPPLLIRAGRDDGVPRGRPVAAAGRRARGAPRGGRGHARARATRWSSTPTGWSSGRRRRSTTAWPQLAAAGARWPRPRDDRRAAAGGRERAAPRRRRGARRLSVGVRQPSSVAS